MALEFALYKIDEKWGYTSEIPFEYEFIVAKAEFLLSSMRSAVATMSGKELPLVAATTAIVNVQDLAYPPATTSSAAGPNVPTTFEQLLKVFMKLMHAFELAVLHYEQSMLRLQESKPNISWYHLDGVRNPPGHRDFGVIAESYYNEMFEATQHLRRGATE